MVTWEQVAAWVRSEAPEGEALDFKGAFWPEKGTRPRAEEIAKDAAAFLNHRGGVLVVGVADDADRAAGFTGVPVPDHADQTVMQALQRHLVPQSASGAVHAYVVAGTHDGVARQVLIIEIGGWAHGPVAVRVGDGLYRLPIRKGAHTEEIPWEQAMRDLNSSHRRNWLRFTGWREANDRLGVFVGTAIRAQAADGSSSVVPCLIEEPFAELGQVDADVVHLRVLRTAFVRWVTTIAPQVEKVRAGVQEELPQLLLTGLGLAAARQVWNDTRATIDVPVPYEVIRAAWVETPPASPPRLHLLLDGDLVFGGQRWYVRAAQR
ncbi:MAG: ATP-binding protein [Myxococcota bacterium]